MLKIHSGVGHEGANEIAERHGGSKIDHKNN
jgi:hypothetical protein